MPKIRLYVENEISNNDEIKISSNQLHYLRNVMRVRNDQPIFVFNPLFGEWETRLQVNTLKKISCVKVREQDYPDIWICFSLVKTKNINTLVEKVSEIGVTKIFPLTTRFSNMHHIKVERLQKIAIESVEQSGGINIPKVMNIMNLNEIINNFEEDRNIIFCDEKYERNFFLKRSDKTTLKKIAILIGPVGGWSDDERKKILEIPNCIRVSLGERILKADTSAILVTGFFKALKLGMNGE